MNIDKLSAIISSKQISQNVILKNIHRLINGDLSHIGDAIKKGLEIEFRIGEEWHQIEELGFDASPESYRVKVNFVNLGGIMIPKPESEPLKKGATYYSVGLYFYGYGFDTHSWKNNSSDHDYLKSNIIHLTKENAQNHANALDKLHQF